MSRVGEGIPPFTGRNALSLPLLRRRDRQGLSIAATKPASLPNCTLGVPALHPHLGAPILGIRELHPHVGSPISGTLRRASSVSSLYGYASLSRLAATRAGRTADVSEARSALEDMISNWVRVLPEGSRGAFREEANFVLGLLAPRFG